MSVSGRAPAVCSGRRILFEDRIVRVDNLIVFEREKKGWYFDPNHWLLAQEAGVSPEELWYILSNPPFSFPLDSCRKRKKCLADECCQTPPGLTEKELLSFIKNGYGQDIFDFSGYNVRLKRESRYCVFYQRGCQLFGNSLRPQQCRWRYCWGDVILNGGDLARYILSWYPPVSSYRAHELCGGQR